MYCLQYTKSDELLTPPVIKLAAEDVKKFLPDGVKNFLPTHVKNSLPRHVKNSLPCGCKITLPRTILIGFILKVDEEPVLKFLWKVEIVIVCAAAQEISVGDHKRISFPSLAFSRMDSGSLESLSFPQVRRIRLRKP